MNRTVRRVVSTIAAIIVLAGTLTTPAAAATGKRIWNAGSGWCLKARTGSTEVIAGSCDDTPHALWIFQKNGYGTNNYYLVNTSGAVNMCLEQDTGNYSTVVRISWCSGARNQSWWVYFENPANAIVSDYSGWYLEHATPSGRIGTNPYNGGSRQQWYNN